MSLSLPIRNTILPLRVQDRINDMFARATGFSGPQILDFFSRYDINIESYPQSGAPSRKVMFEDCLARFDRGKQLTIVSELLDYDGPMKHGFPREEDVEFVRSWLVSQGMGVDRTMQPESSPSKSASTSSSLPRRDQDVAEWDVFISHASEDKEDFARPLAHALRDRGLGVWFDEFTLRVGDSLRRSIDKGLAQARYGVVVISPAFLGKDWPQKELDGLVAREVGGRKVILPVWHNLDASVLLRHSPLLADRLATSSSKGLNHVVIELLAAIGHSSEAVASRTVRPASQLSRGERIVLDCFRGKPDVRWTPEVVVASLQSNRPDISPPASEILTAIASLFESGYLIPDGANAMAITAKALDYYRAHGRTG